MSFRWTKDARYVSRALSFLFHRLFRFVSRLYKRFSRLPFLMVERREFFFRQRRLIEVIINFLVRNAHFHARAEVARSKSEKLHGSATCTRARLIELATLLTRQSETRNSFKSYFSPACLFSTIPLPFAFLYHFVPVLEFN